MAKITQINNARIMMKYNTEEYWLNHNIIPLQGEIVIYSYADKVKIKVGNGVQRLSDIDFIIDVDNKLSNNSQNAVTNEATTKGLEALFNFVNTHYGELADCLTDSISEQGAIGDTKTEIPTAKAVSDFVEDALANQAQVVLHTWAPED